MTISDDTMASFVQFAVYLGISYLLAFWTQNNLNYWFTHFKGEETDVAFVWAWLLSLFPPTIFYNIVSQIVKMSM